MSENIELNDNAAELAHIFQIAEQELEGLNAEDAALSMMTSYGTVLRDVYDANSEVYVRAKDGRLYQAGFALAARGIEGALHRRGESLPVVDNNADNVEYYLSLTQLARTHPQHQYGIKLALIRHETPLLEAVESASEHEIDLDGDRMSLYDGALDAYMMLAEAVRIRQTTHALADLA